MGNTYPPRVPLAVGVFVRDRESDIGGAEKSRGTRKGASGAKACGEADEDGNEEADEDGIDTVLAAQLVI